MNTGQVGWTSQNTPSQGTVALAVEKGEGCRYPKKNGEGAEQFRTTIAFNNILGIMSNFGSDVNTLESAHRAPSIQVFKL